MPVIQKIALAGAIVILCAQSTSAQDAEPIRYDRKLEKAAEARVSSKLGELRGAIRPEVKNYLYSENTPPPPPSPGFPIIEEPQQSPETNSLPPLVMIKPTNDPQISDGPPYWEKL